MDAKIYDKFGNYIEFKSNDSTCNTELSEFIQNLHKDTIYKTSEYPNFFEEYSKYRDLKGNELPKPNSADFYIVIFWTAWTGRLNKTHVKIWEELAKENKNCEIEVLKLNLDIQNHWNKEERERIIKGESTTRNWTTEQIQDILNGRTPKYDGKPIQGHHSYSASKFPHLADKGEIIYPVTPNEHLKGWHGGNFKNSRPGEPIIDINDF